MRKHSIWLSVLFSLGLAGTGCGGDGDGGGGTGTGNTPGTGATGGTPSGDVCAFVCNSDCLGMIGGLPADSIPDCIAGCEMVGLYDDCESEVRAFLGCLEANDCGESNVTACVDSALAFSMCFTPF